MPKQAATTVSAKRYTVHCTADNPSFLDDSFRCQCKQGRTDHWVMESYVNLKFREEAKRQKGKK